MVFLAGLVLTACTTPPVEEFRTYRDAFNQAQDSARIVIADFASTLTALKKFNENAEPADVFEVKFDPADVKDQNDQDIIAVRLLALDTIAAYNEAMLALVEGKRDEEASAAVGELGASVQTLATSLGGSLTILLPIGQSLAALAQKEADRQVFIDGLREGQGIVTNITEFLIDDTKSYFAVKDNLLAEVEHNKLKNETASTANLMVHLARSHGKPTNNGAKLIEARDQAAMRMVAVMKGLGLDPDELGETDKVSNSKLPFGADEKLPEFGNLAQSQMDQFVATLDVIDTKRIALQEKLINYRALLADYVRLLRRVQSALIAASTAPEYRQNLQQTIGQLMPIALQIKDAMSQIKGS